MNEKLINEIIKLHQDHQSLENNHQEKITILSSLRSECQKLEKLKEAYQKQEEDCHNNKINSKENVNLSNYLLHISITSLSLSKRMNYY